MREILGSTAYDALTPSARLLVWTTLKDAEAKTSGLALSKSQSKLLLEAPVKKAWVGTLEFTPEQVFGRAKGIDLNEQTRTALTKQFRDAVANNVGFGVTYEKALQLARSIIQMELSRRR